jgi:cytochrome P450 PksS
MTAQRSAGGVAAPFENVDIASPRFKADPFATYARWRADAPVVQVALKGADRRAETAWLVSRYADVSALLKDDRLAKDPANAGQPPLTMPRFARPLLRNMLGVDDPDHARLKRLVMAAFTPRRVATLRERTEATSARLLDGLAGRGHFDLVADYALALPVAVICDLLGVPAADRRRFAHWSGALIRGNTSSWAMLRELPQLVAFLAYLRRFIAAKRADLGDDLVSDLVMQEGDALDADELMAMVAILLNAGHETTTSLIANGTVALLADPDAAANVRRDPDMPAAGVDELLRFAGPVATSTHRYARDPISIAGVTIPRGGLVLGVIASANRDAAQFADPDRLDLARSPNRHLSFGEGGHYCVGASLARLEGQIAFRDLFTRLPRLRVAGPLAWRPGLVLTGLSRCPVAPG